MSKDYRPPSRLLALLRSDAVFWSALAVCVLALAIWAVRIVP